MKLSSEHDIFDWPLSRSKPIGIIDGLTGCGKTVAAMAISKFHLNHGQYVHYFSDYHHVEDIVKETSSKYPGQFFLHSGDALRDAEKWDFHENAMIVVDEVNEISRRINLSSSLLTIMRRSPVYVLLICQLASDIPAMRCIKDYLSGFLLGTMHDFERGLNVEYLDSFVAGKIQAKHLYDLNTLGFNRFIKESKFILLQRESAEIVTFSDEVK